MARDFAASLAKMRGYREVNMAQKRGRPFRHGMSRQTPWQGMSSQGACA
jgi:hypothetical protein